MNESARQLALVGAQLGPSIVVAALAVVPLVAGYVVLARAARGRKRISGASSLTGAVPIAVGLRHELLGNYERLRRAGEAVPLSTEAWQQVSGRTDVLPGSVAEEVGRAYQAVVVSNRLLEASSAYDSRGHLSIRQRRLALWPTLETAVWCALEALGCNVDRIACVHRSAVVSEIGESREAGGMRPGGNLFNMSRAPRLALVYGEGGPSAKGRVVDSATSRRPRVHRRKRSGRAGDRVDDGQMVLWESVA